jgi:hypothetical protein
MKPPTSRATHARKRPPPHTFSPPPPADAGAGQPDAHGRIDPEQRRALIAEAAYYRAEQRGFEPGRELEDWCAAESDIDSVLGRVAAPTPCGP